MTQMTTVEELIEILNADPEVRQRLFEAFGLSALPELYRRMDAFEQTQQRILETLAQHSEMLRRHGEILKEHSDSLRVLRENVTTLDGNVDDLKAMVRGEQVERKAFNVVSGRLGRITDKRIRRIEPILTQSGAINYNMQNLWPVQDAHVDGKLSDSDYDRLMVTDLIFRAYFQQTLHLFPVEVSNTIDEDDVDRAVRSADILKEVFDDAETTPIVAGTMISPWVEMHAEKLGVEVVTFVLDRTS